MDAFPKRCQTSSPAHLTMIRLHKPKTIAMMNRFSIELRSQTSEVLSLCLAGITHSFLLFSFFPYAGYMSVSLLEEDRTVTVNNIGVYAGMLGAAYTLGRFLGFLPWKVVRKSLGEKYALVLSLGLTGLASLWVGICTSFSGALLARLIQGLSNCVSGSVKRAAANARHNRKQELMTSSESSLPHELVYDANPEALVLAVMWWGSAIGPVVGGLLSDPGFLETVFGRNESLFAWYQAYPYLLSNGFSAILCWISMVCVAMASEGSSRNDADVEKEGEMRPLLAPPVTRGLPETTEFRRLLDFFQTLWKTNRDAKYHLIAYWAFSFVTVCIDEALPLFLITSIDSTGLGLSEGRVGLLLSATGFLVALSHHAALDNLFDIENGSKGGMYRVLSICAFLGNIPVVLVPLALVLNDTGHKSMVLGLTPWSFLYLVFLFAFLRGSAAIFFSLIGIKTGRTLKVAHKNEVARIMTMGALLVRSVAPIVAGALVSHFIAPLPSAVTVTSPLFSSWMVWIVIGLGFGLVVVILTISLSTMPQGEWMTEKHQTYLADRLAREEMHKAIYPKTPPTWKGHTVSPGVDFDKVSFFVIGTHKNDKKCSPHVLTPPIMEALQKHVPTNCSESNFWLKYSLLRDGASMHSLEARSGVSRNTILAIETLKGDIFGCFMTTPWIPTNNTYRRSGESFLWRLKKRRISISTPGVDEESYKMDTDNPIIDVYSWTGKNELCQLFADDKIGVGGGVVGDHSDGFGILLQGDLLHGSSSPCETYGNPTSLCADDENSFEVANIEIWGLTPYMFVTDAERNEHHLRFIKENSILSNGVYSHSESPASATAWSTFL